jgi:hypothetical protein
MLAGRNILTEAGGCWAPPTGATASAAIATAALASAVAMAAVA